jgi:hypothetical protein
MSHPALDGFEQLPLSTEEEWKGKPDIGLTDLHLPDVDRSTLRGIDVREVVDIKPGAPWKCVGSAGFVSCSGVIVRDATSGIHTFGHLQPGVMSFENHMKGRQIRGEAVMICGDISKPPYEVLRGLRDGKWGEIETKVISFEAGGSWWAAILKIMAGEVLIAREKPAPSILRYQAFPSLEI